VANVPVASGNACSFVIDGHGGSCGTYDLRISEYVPRVVECPPGVIDRARRTLSLIAIVWPSP